MAFPKKTSLLWDRITHIVANNPVLKANVKTLQLWTGTPADSVKWTRNALPALRLTPLGRGAQWSAESQHDNLFGVQLDLGMGGTDAGDIMDFWDAVQAAFFPGDNSVLNTLLSNHQVYNITASDPAYSVSELEADYQAMLARGTLLFRRHVNT